MWFEHHTPSDGLLRVGDIALHYFPERLTVAGARWLDDHGVDASASVRRVADMTNPEHSLWMHFITLACEARGLVVHTESEALLSLKRDRKDGEPVRQGFLNISGKKRKLLLRPDVLAYEPDGVTWFEIDRCKRGDDREASLAALVHRIGDKIIATGHILRRVVVHAKTERILNACVVSLTRASDSHQSGSTDP